MIRLTPSVSHIGAGLGEPDGKEIQAFNYITIGEESQWGGGGGGIWAMHQRKGVLFGIPSPTCKLDTSNKGRESFLSNGQILVLF